MFRLRRNTIVPEQPAAESEALVVNVPDIKDYLVREFEKSRSLESRNKELESKIEGLEQIKIKYEAAMVMLDRYSCELQSKDMEIDTFKDKIQTSKNETGKIRDDLNSYKIEFHRLQAKNKELLHVSQKNRDEVFEELKTDLLPKLKNDIFELIRSYRGSVSKGRISELIEAAFTNAEEATLLDLQNSLKQGDEIV